MNQPDLLKSVLEGISDAIIFTDFELNILFFSKGAERTFGYNESDVAGWKLAYIIDSITSIYNRSINLFKTYQNLNCRNKDGKDIKVDLVNYSYHEGKGITWVFREHNDNKIELFLDIYHDNIEKDLFRQVNEKTHALENLTLALVNALENANLLNDTETGNHILRVSEFSGLLAECLNLPQDFIKRIKLYSPLHDVGKVGIPDRLLKKHGRYSDSESKQMQEHVIIGARMLESSEIDNMAKNIVLFHHEKWNGKGYVKGLKGEEIPYEARIVSVADIYDALLSKRVYKKAFTRDRSHEILRELSGIELDPKIVEALLDNTSKFNELIDNKVGQGISQ